jgi:hypothetical protein
MKQERKKRLDEIGLEVQGNVNEGNWNVQFKKLQDYNEKYGHCKLFCAVDRFRSFCIPPLRLHLSLSLNCRQCTTEVQS